MQKEHLKKIIASLPHSPGVYKYYDKDGNLMYIGKAKNLKKRVSSYFSKQHFESRKTEVLVSRIHEIRFTLVETETDALLLENSLIKKYQPRYNVSLKDGKTYPFICIKKEHFPRIFSTRRYVKDGSEYFGPYANGTIKATIMELVKTLYPLRTCNLHLSESNINAGKFKACLEYDIGNCKAPCVALQSAEDYSQNIKQIKNILRGNLGEVRQHLKLLMHQHAEALRYEQAALYKKKLDALDNYQSKSTIVTGIDHEVDVYSIVSDARFAFVNFLKVSNGMVVQTQTFELKKKMDESDEELLALVIAEARETFHSQSQELIVPFPVEWFESSEKHVEITVPKAGDKKRLLELSLKNAMYYKRDKVAQFEAADPGLKTQRILEQMKADLRLTELPAHIECFDNSNLQGTNPVSACVVFKDARPSKKDYRHFIPRNVSGPNDFATMEEVVYRRYRGLLEQQEPLPNLIIIDGGKGQLSSAVSSLKKLNLYGKIPVIGIAKRLEELYYPNDELPLYIDKKSETLKIIQQLRDEAHRFGITHHRKRRDKNTLVTELEAIEGIGPKASNALLEKLKSVKKIKETGIDELEVIVGKAKARLVWEYFQPKS